MAPLMKLPVKALPVSILLEKRFIMGLIFLDKGNSLGQTIKFKTYHLLKIRNLKRWSPDKVKLNKNLYICTLNYVD
jgi:hypothetical protein